MNIPAGATQFQKITFNGSQAVDPTPGGSGEYPTIPHKPIFINGGTEIRFRDMSLPERDLNGSVDLSQGDIATVDPDNPRVWTLNVPVTVENAGVKLDVPDGAVVTFPVGEHPRLSISRSIRAYRFRCRPA